MIPFTIFLYKITISKENVFSFKMSKNVYEFQVPDIYAYVIMKKANGDDVMTYEDYCEMYENGFDEVRRKS